MKKITILLNAFIALFLMSACSSDSEIEQEKKQNTEQENTVESAYTFAYSVSITDHDGNNLLSKNPLTDSGLYGEYHLYLKTEEDSQATFKIASSDDTPLHLNVVVDAQGKEGLNTHTMTLQCGSGNMATVDRITCEVERNGENVSCTKIWVNNALKWENKATSVQPLLTLIKPENCTRLPDATPILLNLPEKIAKDNAFAFDIFKATYQGATKEESNVFISPLSISYALNMATHGAAGETKSQLIETLKAKDFSLNQINEYSKDLSEALRNADPSTSLLLANSVWSAPGFMVKDQFIATNKTYYDAEVSTIDFTSPDALSIINGWCAEKTNNRIPEALDQINPLTVMMLINTLYFKSGWLEQYKFDKEFTTTEDFYSENNGTQQVDMMQNTDSYPYASDENASYLAIPFGNKAYSMVFALPHENKTINDLINNLNEDTWKTYSALSYRYVSLRLPRFKTECSYRLEKNILPSMGLTLPFTTSADFSNISTTKTFISTIIHKTFVEVNEDGAEAAAVTIVISDVECSGDEPPIPLDFRINKPFVFAIQENSTGLILFMGKIGEITE